MTLVIDACTAVKWYFEQPGWQAARLIAASQEELIAPDLIYAETGSAIWKYARTGLISTDDADAIMRNILLRIDRFAPLSSLAALALSKAMIIGHPIYDCFYLALAEQEGAPLVTADRRLAKAAQTQPGIEVRLLDSA